MAQTYKAQVDPIGSFEVPVEEAIALDLSPDTEEWEGENEKGNSSKGQAPWAVPRDFLSKNRPASPP